MLSASHPSLFTARRATAFGVLVLALMALVWWVAAEQPLALTVAGWLKEANLLRSQAPLLYLAGFSLLFMLLSALALPGCALLALLAGESFGWLGGTVLVGLCSTMGALLSFQAARTLARQTAQRRFGHHLALLESRLEQRHGLWLFWLRLVPVLPYPLLNPLLGLSRIPTARFFWPSLAGLTLGSLPYVLAGCSLGPWAKGLTSPNLPLLAAALGLMTAGMVLALRARRSRHAQSAQRQP